VYLPLIVTLIITLELEQVFQLVVTHVAVQDSLDLILFLTVDECYGWGGTGRRPRIGSGGTGDNLTTGKMG
jgi:hypothetical protein